MDEIEGKMIVNGDTKKSWASLLLHSRIIPSPPFIHSVLLTNSPMHPCLQDSLSHGRMERFHRKIIRWTKRDRPEKTIR